MDPQLQQLYSVYRFAAQEESKTQTGETIQVSEMVSHAASVYEIIRNSMEYTEKHLVRRNAIRRILRRRLASDVEIRKVAEGLLHELIWARYLPNESIPAVRIDEIEALLRKYQAFFTAAERENQQKAYKRMVSWILDVASTEIEYLLVPPRREEALVSYAYNAIRKRVRWSKKVDIKDEEHDLQLFISVHRALLKSNRATLRYRTFLLFYPQWGQADETLISQVASRLDVVIETIDRHVSHPVGERISRMVRKKSGYFRILHDLLMEKGDEFTSLIASEDALREATQAAASKRYKSFRSRIGRSVVRSFIFIFLSKMLLAILLEIPYDLVFLGHIDWGPIAINVFFPPLLLAFLGFTVTLPTKKNTKALVKGIRSLVADGRDIEFRINIRKTWGRVADVVFSMLYVFTFVLSYGVLAVLLTFANFTPMSTGLFLLFVSLIAFFGVNIRYSKYDLVVLSQRGGVFTFLFDLFALPIIRLGRFVALRAPSVNLFLFFLDFIIEAPFKTTIQLFEGWFAFLKEKREEIE